MSHAVRNALASLFLLAMAATALALPPNDWSWQNPLPQGNDLEAVWGRAANDVYAIGGQQTLMHWNGADWSVAARPTSMPITDMWGLDSGVLFAVGWYGAVLRFDGGEWTEIPFPPGANLKAVVAFSETEVYVAETFSGTRIWRYDGATWTEIGTAPDGIHDMGGTGPDDIYVGGFYGTLTHWNGAVWTPVDVFPEIDVTSVWSNAVNDVFALLQGSQLYHFDGGDWSLVGSDATGAWESDMWGTSFHNLWFVDEGGGASHFDGATVTEFDLAVDGLVGVWGDDLGTVHAVGPAGSVATHDGAQWNAHSTAATNENLLTIWQISEDDVYAGGFLESAIHWDGSSWTSIRETAFSVWFTDIWASGPDDVFFVGKAGVNHWNGASWTPMDSGLLNNLTHNGVWGFGPDDVVVVANWGAISRYDGMGWTVVRDSDPGQGHLMAVWGAAPDDIWAVGPQNEFLHWDGLAWNPVVVPSQGLQTDIVGWASDDIWALGEGGELFHYDGMQWSADHSLLGEPLTGIDGESSDSLHAVASYGYVWRHDGGDWTQVDTGARTGINTIASRGTGGVLIAGQGGSVLCGTSATTAAPEFVAGAPLHLRSEPNPFNPSTAIRFEMPRAGHARLTIHDARGLRIATLLDESVAAGARSVTWDGRDDSGRRVASGVYLVQVRTDTGREVQKVALIK